MKHLNFLSNLLSLSLGSPCTDVSLDRRFTVGSPSGRYSSGLMRLVFILAILLTIGVGNAWGLSVTYTTSSGSPSASGNTITGSSASFADDTNQSNHTQMLSGGYVELTLTSLGGINISNISLSMKSNKKGGAGKLLYSTNGGTNWTYLVGTSSAGVAFSHSDWNGAYTTSYTDISKSVSLSNVTSLKIKIESTDNSLYCQSFTLTYTAGGASYTLTFKEWDGGGAASGSPSTGSVTANATSFSFGATAPSKTGHDIEGFYTNTSASSGVKVANSSRQFVASIDGWTNASSQYTKGANTNLYIKWTPASYTITSTLSNCSWSSAISSPYTYTGDANAIVRTVNPSSGYGCPDNITVTMGGSTLTVSTDYTWSVTNGVGSFTLKKVITGNVAITITATPMVTWMAGGEVFSTQRGAANTALTNPGTPASATYCDGVKTFVGWTATPIVGSTNTEPSDLFASAEATSLKIPAGGATYYAVFASVSGIYGKYKRVTSSSASTDIAAGQYIAIVAYNSHSSYQSWQILGVTAAKNGYDYSSAPSETSSQINEPDRRFLWKISKTSGYWVFNSKHSTSKKIATSGSSSGSALNWSTQTYSKWEYGDNSSESNTFYLRLYDNSSITNCGLERYNTSWQIYYNSPSYVYNTSAAFKMKFYVPAYMCSNYCTTCCTALGSINGSFF